MTGLQMRSSPSSRCQAVGRFFIFILLAISTSALEVGRVFGMENPPTTRFANNRSDKDLVAGYGTCQVDDFRILTLLRAESWDFLHWATFGNAVQGAVGFSGWTYEQRLRVSVDGEEVTPDAQVQQVEQQFDFRLLEVSAPALTIERLDTVMSSRQWTTALRVTNRKSGPARFVVVVEWTTQDKGALDVRPWSDGGSNGFCYSIANGPPTLVSLGAQGTWKANGNAVVCSRWEMDLKPDEAKTVDMNVFVGWAKMPAYRDKGPGVCATVEQATLDRRADSDGFRRVMAGLGVSAIGDQWHDLQKTCDAKRHFLYDRMPQLVGFDPEWDGMWRYTFDLIRSGIYPAQGNFKGEWVVGDLLGYRDMFYWDSAATTHTFCNWDAGLCARMMRTFWSSMLPEGAVCVSANPFRTFDNPTPQLANEMMALWECYRITRDKELLRLFYPIIVRHVRWLETKRNHTPDGPLMDIGCNIDYGPPLLFQGPTIWPDVQFFLVDRYQRLAKVATLIGRPQAEVDEWSGKAAELAEAIRKHMWDETEGTFWCVTDKLEFKKVPSPIEFHSMTTGVATRQQAERLLLRLKDPAKYAPNAKFPYGLPSVPFDSPSFHVTDGWSGTIWPIQTYYTVRGLVDYGFPDEAAALTTNLYGMMARHYWGTGSIWEQYDPATGNNLSAIVPGHARGFFVSGITTTAPDMLLRGVIGFDRTDDPLAFFLTPRPMKADWHGIENLTLSGNIKLAIQIKDNGNSAACKVRVTGLESGRARIGISANGKSYRELPLDGHNEVETVLTETEGTRYLWKFIEP